LPSDARPLLLYAALVPPLWLIAVAVVVGAGYIAGILHGPAVLWLLAMGVSAWRLRASRGRSRAGWIAATALVGLLLGLHVLPGFSNPVVVRGRVLSPGALPYSQYVNVDKTLGAVLLLGCSGWAPMRSRADWRSALRRTAPVTLGTVAVVMAASLALGYVRFEPRWTSLFYLWAPLNLFTTCVSEEAFFRGFVQNELRNALPRQQAGTIAVAASGALFGLAHAAGGWRYALLAGVAGIGYALAYERTARLEMSILTHFTLNAAHFLLFTYPALA
jgi:membrane protease YdiL (CAAX protease family)